jgi:hypothetical protein
MWHGDGITSTVLVKSIAIYPCRHHRTSVVGSSQIDKLVINYWRDGKHVYEYIYMSEAREEQKTIENGVIIYYV